ncbi:histidine--tRNA ligase, cytoplasmic [Tanacetum coccineum]
MATVKGEKGDDNWRWSWSKAVLRRCSTVAYMAELGRCLVLTYIAELGYGQSLVRLNKRVQADATIGYMNTGQTYGFCGQWKQLNTMLTMTLPGLNSCCRAEMAGERRVLTLGGKGSSLSPASVFEFTTANPPQILKINPSALARLSSSPSASTLLLLNKLLIGGSTSLSAASQLSDILNNDAQTFTLNLELDQQDDVDLLKNCWSDITISAICALLDSTTSSLSTVAAVAALSCEALKTDTTIAFNFFTDSGDGFSDKDRASISDFKVLLNGSKMRGNTQCDLVFDIPRTHGRLRSLCKSNHSSIRVELNSISLVHGGASKDLTRLFSSLAFALQSLGEGGWLRAKLCLDNLVQDNLFPNLVESFNAGCPNIDKLEGSIMSFVASGNGAQCELIIQKYELVHISTRDLLRSEVAAGSEIGNQAKEYMNFGRLVLDEVVTAMVIGRLSRADAKEKGWILDGFPRSFAQAQSLEKMKTRPDVFIALDVISDEILIDICVGTRLDPETGKIYHIKNFPPETEEVKARLITHPDDIEEKVYSLGYLIGTWAAG